MAAFVWNTNPRMWKVVPPFADAFDVLAAYITDGSAYVYWSTPRLQNEIKAGDAAYILRTTHERGAPGIVACGRVAEPPRQLTAGAARLFAQPVRLTPPGWDEQVAPSSWKTGIRIEKTFWDNPIQGVPPAQRTVERLSEDAAREIEREVKGR